MGTNYWDTKIMSIHTQVSSFSIFKFLSISVCGNVMETTLHVSANGNVAETRKILTICPLRVSVVSDLRKHDGNFKLQISVTFSNYGNTLFRPVIEYIKSKIWIIFVRL